MVGPSASSRPTVGFAPGHRGNQLSADRLARTADV